MMALTEAVAVREAAERAVALARDAYLEGRPHAVVADAEAALARARADENAAQARAAKDEVSRQSAQAVRAEEERRGAMERAVAVERRRLAELDASRPPMVVSEDELELVAAAAVIARIARRIVERADRHSAIDIEAFAQEEAIRSKTNPRGHLEAVPPAEVTGHAKASTATARLALVFEGALIEVLGAGAAANVARSLTCANGYDSERINAARARARELLSGGRGGSGGSG